MKKRFLGMVAFLWMGIISFALAQDSPNYPSKLLVYPKDKTQRELGLLPSKQLRKTMPSKRAGKIKNLNNSSNDKKSVSNQGAVKLSPAQGKNLLVDKNGQPVTLWPAGQKKHYTTLYQDPRN